MSFKYIPPSELVKKTTAYLNVRIKALNKAMTKQRNIDRKEKGTWYYSPKWKNMLDEHNNTTNALIKKYEKMGKR